MEKIWHNRNLMEIFIKPLKSESQARFSFEYPLKLSVLKNCLPKPCFYFINVAMETSFYKLWEYPKYKEILALPKNKTKTTDVLQGKSNKTF
jgi:hypothetical protein